MGLHSERLEAKLNAVDWAVRDVLVGTVRSPQQLDICRRHRFYYIPAEQLGDEAFSVRIVALYQSQYVFGPQAGVQYYGEVTKCSPVCRGDITELRARKGTEQNLYYRFEIREWKRLNRPIAARESCFVKGLTSRFQLEHSAETPELWLRSQEEYRLCLNLRQALRSGISQCASREERSLFRTRDGSSRSTRPPISSKMRGACSGSCTGSASRGIP